MIFLTSDEQYINFARPVGAKDKRVRKKRGSVLGGIGGY